MSKTKAVPGEVVEAVRPYLTSAARDGVLLVGIENRDAVAEDLLLAVVSHPAFAPWFLRVLATREPSGPWKVEGDDLTFVYVRHDDRIQQGHYVPIPVGVVFAHALNALAPGGPKEG